MRSVTGYSFVGNCLSCPAAETGHNSPEGSADNANSSNILPRIHWSAVHPFLECRHAEVFKMHVALSSKAMVYNEVLKLSGEKHLCCEASYQESHDT